VRQVLVRFDQVLATAGRSANTRRLYGAAIARWLVFGGKPGHLDPALASHYIGERRRAGLSAAALNLDTKALRAFYRAMHVLGLTGAAEGAKAPAQRREPKRLVRYYTAAEVATLINAPDRSTWVGARDHLVIRTLAETGLRGGELARLELGDILPEGFLFVRAGKGGADRYVPIGADLHAALLAWIAGPRRETHPGKRAVLFVTRTGHGLAGAGAVWRLFVAHARTALGTACGHQPIRGARGSTRKAWTGHSPHLLRASVATALQARGMPINGVAEFLGHASLNSTTRYVAVNIEGLRAELHKNPRLRR
jgi:integrase/recombinase XerD